MTHIIGITTAAAGLFRVRARAARSWQCASLRQLLEDYLLQRRLSCFEFELESLEVGAMLHFDSFWKNIFAEMRFG